MVCTSLVDARAKSGNFRDERGLFEQNAGSGDCCERQEEQCEGRCVIGERTRRTDDWEESGEDGRQRTAPH